MDEAVGILIVFHLQANARGISRLAAAISNFTLPATSRGVFGIVEN